MEWFLLLAGLLHAVALNTDVYQYVNEGGKMEYIVENASLPINGSFEFTGTKGQRIKLMTVEDSKGQQIAQCHFEDLEDRPWHFMNWTLNGSDLHCQADTVFNYVQWFDLTVKTLYIRFDAKKMEQRPNCIRNMTLDGYSVTGCSENNLKKLTTTAAACGCSKTLAKPQATKKPGQKQNNLEIYHFEGGGKMEYLVENTSLPISGRYEFFGSSKPKGWLYLVRLETTKGERLADCSFYELMDNKWHSVNWTVSHDMLHCQTDRDGEYSKEWFDLTWMETKTVSIRFDAQELSQRPSCIRNMTIDNYSISGCSKNTLKKFTSTAAVCGCSGFESPVSPAPTKPPVKDPKPRVNDKAVYHFSTDKKTKVEWALHTDEMPLPISGSYEYMSAPPSFAHSNLTYNLEVYNKNTGESLAICASSQQSDGKTWLKFDWILYNDSIYCGYGNNFNSFTIHWVEQTNLKHFALRFDTDSPPTAIKNITLNKNYSITDCLPKVSNELGKVTLSGLLCDETKPGKAPETGGKDTVYHLKENKKVEWIVDRRILEFPISGSFEYQPVHFTIGSTTKYKYKNARWIQPNTTYTLELYDLHTKEEIVTCYSEKYPEDKKWIKFEWKLGKSGLSCDYDGKNEHGFSWYQPDDHYRYSLRFDTGTGPTAIRNFKLEKKTITGCPPVVPAAIHNFTTVGLQCDGQQTEQPLKTTKSPGKTPEQPEIPQNAGEQIIYQIKKGKTVEWKVDRRTTKFPINGSFEYQPVPLIFDSIIRRNEKGIEIWPNMTYTISLIDLDSGEELASCDSDNYPKGNQKWLKFHWKLDKDTLFCGYTKDTSYTMTWDDTDKYYRYSLRFDTDAPPPATRNFLLNGEPLTGCPPAVPSSIQNFTAEGLQCDGEKTEDLSKTTKSPGKSPELPDIPQNGGENTVYHLKENKKVEWKVDRRTTKFPVNGSFEYQPTPLALDSKTKYNKEGYEIWPNETYTIALYDLYTNEKLVVCTSNKYPKGNETWLKYYWKLDKDVLICGYSQLKKDTQELRWDYPENYYRFGLRFDTDAPPTAIRNFSFNGEALTGCPPVVPSPIQNFTTTGLQCDGEKPESPIATISPGQNTITSTKSPGGMTPGPIKPLEKGTIYSISKEDKVEWVVDSGTTLFPINGSFQYQPVPIPELLLFPNASTYTLMVYDLYTGAYLASCDHMHFSTEPWVNFTWRLNEDTLYCTFGGIQKGQMLEKDPERRRYSLRFDTENSPIAIRYFMVNEEPITGCPPVVRSSIHNFTADGLLCDEEKPAELPITTKSLGEITVTSTKSPIPQSPEENGIYYISKSKKDKVEWTIDKATATFPITGSFEYQPAPPSSSSSTNRGLFTFPNTTYTLTVYDQDTGFHVASCNSNQMPEEGKQWLNFSWQLDENSLICEYNGDKSTFLLNEGSKNWRYSLRFDTVSIPTAIRNFIINGESITGCPPSSSLQDFTISGLLCDVETNSGPKEPEIEYHFSTDIFDEVEWYVDSFQLESGPVSGTYDYLNAPSNPTYKNHTYNLQVYDVDTRDLLANCTSNRTTDGIQSFTPSQNPFPDKVICCYDKCKQPEDMQPFKAQRFFLRFNRANSPAAIKNLVLNENYTITGCPPYVPYEVRRFNATGLLCEGMEPRTALPAETPPETSPMAVTEIPIITTAEPLLVYVENPTVYQFSKEKNAKVEWIVDGAKRTLPVFGHYMYKSNENGKITRNLDIYEADTGDLLANCSTNKASKQWPTFTFMVYKDMVFCCYSHTDSGCNVISFKTKAEVPKLSLRLDTDKSPAAIKNLIINADLNTKDYTNFTITGCPAVLPPAVHDFNTSGLSCGGNESGKTTKVPTTVTPAEDLSENTVYHFSTEKNAKVEWIVDSKKDLPVSGLYDFKSAPTDSVYGNLTINLNVYEIDTGELVINCSTTKISSDKKWLYFGFTLYSDKIFCCYNGCEETYFETNKKAPKFYIRMDTERPPAEIKDLFINTSEKDPESGGNFIVNRMVTGCPPVVTSPVQNFTTTGLRCGGSEPGKTTKAPVTTAPETDGPFVKNPTVYQFSKKSNTKVEWKIDSSVTTLPVYGRYEYKSAPADPDYRNTTINLYIFDASTGDVIVDCYTEKTFPGNKWPYFGFTLYQNMIWCCFESGCEVKEFEMTKKFPKFLVKFSTGERAPAAIKNLILYTDPETTEFYDYTVTGCPAVVPAGVQNLTTSGLLCGDEIKTTKPPAPIPKENLTVYHFSNTGIVEWKVDGWQMLDSGSYEYLPAAPDLNYDNETYNLVVYNTNTGQKMATCSKNLKPAKDEKWIRFAWLLYGPDLWCIYPSGEELTFLKDSDNTTRANLTFRLDIGPRPSAIRNLTFDVNATVTGCPPSVLRPYRNVTVSGLVCAEGDSPDGRTTKIPTGRPLTLLEESPIYHFSSKDTVEWRVEFTTLDMANSMGHMGKYDYISEKLNDETQNVIIYDSDTGKYIANCSRNEKPEKGEKWITMAWATDGRFLWCLYPSSQYAQPLAVSNNLTVTKFTMRLSTERRPAAIRNLSLDSMNITGCPPTVPSSLDVTLVGLVCGEEPPGIPSNTMQPPRTKPTPIPNVEQRPSDEEIDQQEDDRFFQQFAPIAGAVLTIGQGLLCLFH